MKKLIPIVVGLGFLAGIYAWSARGLANHRTSCTWGAEVTCQTDPDPVVDPQPVPEPAPRPDVTPAPAPAAPEPTAKTCE